MSLLSAVSHGCEAVARLHDDDLIMMGRDHHWFVILICNWIRSDESDRDTYRADLPDQRPVNQIIIFSFLIFTFISVSYPTLRLQGERWNHQRWWYKLAQV